MCLSGKDILLRMGNRKGVFIWSFIKQVIKSQVTETDSSKYEKVVKLYAVWEKQGTTYKVTYYNADGSQELKTDSKVSTEESCSFSAYAGAEKKEGYEFIGWSTTPNATAIDYNTTKGPSLKATTPELKLYAVYVKTVKDEQVNINVYVEYLDESLNKGYEVDESSRKEVSKCDLPDRKCP